MNPNDQLELLNKTAHEYFEEPHTCSLCGQTFTGWGNNPEPLKAYNRRCCNECNNTLVIPWRVRYGRGCLPFYLRCGFGKTDPLVFTPAARQRIDRHSDIESYADRLFLESDHKLTHGIEVNRQDAETILKPGDLVEPFGGANGRVYYGRKPDEDDEIAQAVHDALSGKLSGRHNTGVVTQ